TPKIYYLAMVCSFFAIFAAQTRGDLFVLFISLPFLLLKYKPKMAKRIFALGAVAFIGMVAVSLSVGDKSRCRMIKLKDQSSNIRVSQYVAGLTAMKENPVFGLGPVQFSHHVVDIKHRNNIWEPDFDSHSHNTFIEHGANFGVPGFILFI